MGYNIQDVARLAGVSTGTVSNVLNHKVKVSDRTREKVLCAAKELDYSINAVARTLKTKRTNTIAFIIPDISSVFFSLLVKQVESILEKKGITLLVANTLEDLNRQISHLKAFANGSVDGIILASCIRDIGRFEKYLPKDIPVLFIDRAMANSSYSEITVNLHDPLYRATLDLIKRGFHTFGLIAGSPSYTYNIADSRIYGIIDCLQDYSIPFDMSNIICISEINIGAGPCAVELYKRGCDVIFAPNSNCTQESMFYLLDAGAIINKDVAILSVNDDPRDLLGFSNMIYSVFQPTLDIGVQTANRILQMIEHPELPAINIRLNAEYRPMDGRLYSIQRNYIENVPDL